MLIFQGVSQEVSRITKVGHPEKCQCVSLGGEDSLVVKLSETIENSEVIRPFPSQMWCQASCTFLI